MKTTELKIALAGDFYTGKSTLARYLGEKGFEILDVSQLLKEILAKMLASQGIEIGVEEINKHKDQYRNLLLELGKVIKWDEGYGMQLVLRQWEKGGCKTPVVVDTVRTLEQWRLLEKRGFRLVRLSVAAPVIEQRAAQFGVSRERIREIRSYLNSSLLPPQPREWVLDSSGSVEETFRHLLAQVKEGPSVG